MVKKKLQWAARIREHWLQEFEPPHVIQAELEERASTWLAQGSQMVECEDICMFRRCKNLTFIQLCLILCTVRVTSMLGTAVIV